MTNMNELHPATIWEALADQLGERPAIVQGSTRRSWSEFEHNAARLAGVLGDHGFGHDSKLGLYLYNSPEYCEATFAAYKLRGQPVNINYRYVADELAYLLDNSDAIALVHHSSLADCVQAALSDRGLRLILQVDDDGTPVAEGSTDWSTLHSHADAPRRPRDEHDQHILYTGGTTGLPKGVLYDLGDLTRELLAVGASVAGQQVPTSLEAVVCNAERAWDTGSQLTTLILPPLMHGTGMALALITLLSGGTAVLLERFDATAALAAIPKHRVQVVNLVGDAFGRPLVEALDTARAAGRPADLSSLKAIMSSGAMLSSEVRDALLTHAPHAMVIDMLAASEAPMGTSISVAGASAETAKFVLRAGTKVFDANDDEVAAGSDTIGRLAVATRNPIGYYKDPEKTAETFRTIDGIRYSLPGDWARIAEDGSITLLGRGSHCINTGGEKVFPEEVEEALKRHSAVNDAIVFGVDDPRWGQRIEATVSTRSVVSADELRGFVRSLLAPFKAPKIIHFVSEVPRAPNGKADYGAAREHSRTAPRRGRPPPRDNLHDADVSQVRLLMAVLSIFVILAAVGAFIGSVTKRTSGRLIFRPSTFVGVGPVGRQSVIQRRSPTFALRRRDPASDHVREVVTNAQPTDQRRLFRPSLPHEEQVAARSPHVLGKRTFTLARNTGCDLCTVASDGRLSARHWPTQMAPRGLAVVGTRAEPRSQRDFPALPPRR